MYNLLLAFSVDFKIRLIRKALKCILLNFYSSFPVLVNKEFSILFTLLVELLVLDKVVPIQGLFHATDLLKFGFAILKSQSVH